MRNLPAPITILDVTSQGTTEQLSKVIEKPEGAIGFLMYVLMTFAGAPSNPVFLFSYNGSNQSTD